MKKSIEQISKEQDALKDSYAKDSLHVIILDPI
jgi:hypothetical protein